tara:strand:+ start:536 stop:676 length:141 start_codon:yes stop_codon:yes gene_type:complete
MKKLNRSGEKNIDPYEDIVRLEQLDAYEALIKSNLPKRNNKSIEQN